MNESDWNITSAELNPRLKQVTLLDVREPEEYEAIRIAGCKLIPLGELQTRAEAELDKSAEIVIYCAHGVRSVQALMGLKMLGFQNVKSLEGGICAWEEQGFACIS